MKTECALSCTISDIYTPGAREGVALAAARASGLSAARSGAANAGAVAVVGAVAVAVVGASAARSGAGSEESDAGAPDRASAAEIRREIRALAVINRTPHSYVDYAAHVISINVQASLSTKAEQTISQVNVAFGDERTQTTFLLKSKKEN